MCPCQGWRHLLSPRASRGPRMYRHLRASQRSSTRSAGSLQWTLTTSCTCWLWHAHCWPLPIFQLGSCFSIRCQPPRNGARKSCEASAGWSPWRHFRFQRASCALSPAIALAKVRCRLVHAVADIVCVSGCFKVLLSGTKRTEAVPTTQKQAATGMILPSVSIAASTPHSSGQCK